ncbi:hypothetical protein F4825DRAFT_106094 [Nemania diffusa]|nr:hypothetical protein F4825DRAFT_106094 [Nemania diffusa]
MGTGGWLLLALAPHTYPGLTAMKVLACVLDTFFLSVQMVVSYICIHNILLFIPWCARRRHISPRTAIALTRYLPPALMTVF